MKKHLMYILSILPALALVGCCSSAPKSPTTPYDGVAHPSQVILTSAAVSSGTDTISMGVCVYLPQDYSEAQTYPVLYLLHGSGDDETGWVVKGNMQAIMDSLITSGSTVPMVVIMPNGYAEHYNTWFGTDIPEPEQRHWMDGYFETFFPSLMDWTAEHYSVYTDKAHTAIAGLSMGGYHTIHVAGLLQGRFDYVGPFSAVEKVLPQLDTVMTGNPRLFWMAIGEDDFLYRNNVQMRAYMDERGYTYTYHESQGGHDWPNWMDYLRLFTPQLFH